MLKNNQEMRSGGESLEILLNGMNSQMEIGMMMEVNTRKTGIITQLP